MTKKIGTGVKAGILVLVILGAFILIAATPQGRQFMLQMLPGAEGTKVGVYSVQNPKTMMNYVVGRDTDPLASVMPTDPYNVFYDPDDAKLGYPNFMIECSKMWSESEYKEPINYWVKKGDQYVHVAGECHVIYFNLVFRAAPDADAYLPTWPIRSDNTEFETLWTRGTMTFLTGLAIWNLAYPDPLISNKTGRVWGTPLSSYVISGEKASGSSSFIYLVPVAESGRQVTLFSSPQNGSIVDIIGNQEPSNLNSTLYANWGSDSPDSRLKSGQGYFKFTPTNFGVEWGESWTPGRYVWWNEAKIQYNIKMYYLVVGQFIYTQSEYEKWVLGAAESHYQPSFWEAWANSLDKWITGTLMNPLTYLWIGIGAFFIIMVAVIVVAVRAPKALERGKK
jgi:hypothetical protein